MKIKKTSFCQQKRQTAENKLAGEVCFKTHCQYWCKVFSCLNSAQCIYIEEVCVVWLPILHNMGIFADPLCQKPTFFNKIGLNVKKLTNSFFYALCSDKKCKQSAARFLTRLVFIYFNIWLSNLMLQLEFSTHFTYGRSANIKCNLNSLLPVQR